MVRIKYESNRVVDEKTGYSRQYVIIRRICIKNDLCEKINDILPSQFRSKFWKLLSPEHIIAIQNTKVQYQVGSILAQASAPLLPDAKQNAATNRITKIKNV